jgi:hypothetical protein
MVLCLLCVGCTPARVTDSDLVGTWVADDNSAGAQTLVLSSDHTYAQVIDGLTAIKTAEGTWAVAGGSAPTVLLHDALLFNSGARGPASPWSHGDWTLRVRRDWRGVHLDYEGAGPSGFTKSRSPDQRGPG